MFAHQVIEDMKSIHKDCYPWEIVKNEKYMWNAGSIHTEEIQKSHKFHIKNPDNVFDALYQEGLTYENNRDTFIRKYCHLPYDECWFDFLVIDDGITFKFACLASSYKRKEKEEICIDVFFFQKGRWVCFPGDSAITIFRDPEIDDPLFVDYGYDEDLFSEEEFFEGPLSLFDPEYAVLDLINVLVALNIKGFPVEKIAAPQKLNKKRAQKGKSPIFSYRILDVDLFSKPKSSSRSRNISILRREHWVRGHVKYFSEDRRLYGKYTGAFFWKPHKRGDAALGRIVKDYNLKGENK